MCNGTNVLGSVSSNATSFVVVPNPREYEHLAFPTTLPKDAGKLSVTVDGNATTNVTKLQGQEVELLCIIDYSHELRTNFSWNMEILSGVTSVAILEMQLEITLAKLLTCLATTAEQSQ